MGRREVAEALGQQDTHVVKMPLVRIAELQPGECININLDESGAKGAKLDPKYLGGGSANYLRAQPFLSITAVKGTEAGGDEIGKVMKRQKALRMKKRKLDEKEQQEREKAKENGLRVLKEEYKRNKDQFKKKRLVLKKTSI